MMLPSEESLMVCRDYMLENWQHWDESSPLWYVDYLHQRDFCIDYLHQRDFCITSLDALMNKHLPNYGRGGLPAFTANQVTAINQFVKGLVWKKYDRTLARGKINELRNWIN